MKMDKSTNNKERMEERKLIEKPLVYSFVTVCVCVCVSDSVFVCIIYFRKTMNMCGNVFCVLAVNEIGWLEILWKQ
jgi:hypothetical protein